MLTAIEQNIRNLNFKPFQNLFDQPKIKLINHKSSTKKNKIQFEEMFKLND